MKLFFLIGILTLCLRVKGQRDSILNFRNQGEEDNYWARSKFKTEYKKNNYERYCGDIKQLDTTTFKYDSQVFKVIESSNAIRQLFTLGILYPTLITSNSIGDDSLTGGQKVFKNLFRSDTLHISNIEELKFLEKSPKVKRFRFWLYWKGVLNPFAYLFELINDTATKQTDMEKFIKGASLTFFKQGWVVI